MKRVWRRVKFRWQNCRELVRPYRVGTDRITDWTSPISKEQ